jgi:hypothetical protein
MKTDFSKGGRRMRRSMKSLPHKTRSCIETEFLKRLSLQIKLNEYLSRYSLISLIYIFTFFKTIYYHYIAIYYMKMLILNKA